MTRIMGNTYPVKDRLKALGGRWNSLAKCWEVPEDKAEEASLLLFPAQPAAEALKLATDGLRAPTRRPNGRAARTCKDCGCKINYGVYCGKCEYR